jgi:hypothetical protein
VTGVQTCALPISVLSLALVAVGCTVGGGSGTASGMLSVLGCNDKDTLKDPQPYDLKPTFFAGEPIEDICPLPGGMCPGEHTNRLLIRLQRLGNRIEVNDTLYFDVENALEVAKCVRGRTVAGAPTWDTRMVSNPDGTLTDLPWCDRGGAPADGGATDAAADLDGGAAADGGAAPVPTGALARISLSTADFVRASFSPLYSCVEAKLVGVALPGSWIEFADFGTAGQPSRAADAREKVSDDFKVNFGERLRATFHLVLGDQRVANAQKNRDAVPSARVGGWLDGQFDFDLARGRAAQPFP